VDSPVLVDDFAGAGGSWLPNYGELTPPVSWMGGKRRIAPETFKLLGLRIGGCVDALVNDASWWGWVWPTALDETDGPAVSEVLRGWRGEDPRGLWFRLRDAGPMPGRVDGAAQLLWLQARAASGVPVWWEGAGMTGPGFNTGQRARDEKRAAERVGGEQARLLASDGRGDPRESGQRTTRDERPALIQAAHERGPYVASMSGDKALKLVQWASTQIDGAGQRQASETRNAKGYNGTGRLIATSRGNQAPGAPFDAGHKGTDIRGGGGIVDPGTIADRLDTIRRAVARSSRPLLFVHGDACALADEWAPRLGKRARVSRDPPYEHATGYPVTCPRSEVLRSSEVWARYGARVVVHEAVGLASDLGPGWTQLQLRTGRKQEWVTVYGCDVRDVLPPLLRLGA